MKATVTTWMMLQEGTRVLLGWKRRGFGEGKLNGIGGKVEEGESVEVAAIREMEEETGVRVTKMEKVGRMVYEDLIYGGKREEMYMHLFIGTEWDGEPRETEEERPEWFEASEVPIDKMWVDDEYWMPEVLAGKKVEGRFKFDENFQIVEKDVRIIS